MNPVVLYFASGESLYSGAVLLVFAIVVSPFLQNQVAALLRNIVAWLALAMFVMASPPFVWVTHAVFYVSFVSWYLASNLTTTPPRTKVKAEIASAVILLLLLVTLSLSEYSRRAMPEIVAPPADHLVVIGDSISSGIDPHVPAWPVILQQMTGVPVKNLARPGARTIEGQEMARQISSADQVVLIEIGGNDLLSDVPSKEFGQALDVLLLNVTAPGRTVAMFELPLLPQKIPYGQIQRRLATKYGVQLIPKRYFVDVIRGADATSDGVHLSDAGARRMATLVTQALSSVLKPPQRIDNSTPHPSN
jgi:lysophospholipase L1-like esterase